MSDSTNGSVREGYFCKHCGGFVDLGSSICPNCSRERDQPSEDGFHFVVSLDVAECDECGKLFSLGQSHCVHCQAPFDSDIGASTSSSRLGSAKVALFGEEVERISNQIVGLPCNLLRVVTVTDEQFLSFINRNQLIDPKPLSSLKAFLNDLRLTSKSAIKSQRTKSAITSIISGTDQLIRDYIELISLAVNERLQRFHLLVTAQYRGYIDLYHASLRGIMATTIEEASESQRSVEVELSRLGENANLMHEEISVIDDTHLFGEEIIRRVSLFVGEARSYEIQGEPDYALALSTAIGDRGIIQASPELDKKARDFFSGMPSFSPPTEMPGYMSLVLYHLALEISALPDPLTVTTRANVLLELYCEARDASSGGFLTLLTAAELESTEALSNHLINYERMQQTRITRMSLDARRRESVSIYRDIVEDTYSKLLGVPILAKYILSGTNVSYSTVRQMDFGSRFNFISQVDDPRYAPALLGVDTVARNAGSHAGVGTTGDLMLLKSVDRKQVVKTVTYTDEEFLELQAQLSITCNAMILAESLFRIQHFGELASSGQGFFRPLSVRSAKSTLGFFGLVAPIVDADGTQVLIAHASEDSMQPSNRYLDHINALVSMTALFPEHVLSKLAVGCRDGRTYTLEVEVPEVFRHTQVNEHLAKYSVVRQISILAKQLPDRGSTLEFAAEPFRVLARILMNDLKAIVFEYASNSIRLPILLECIDQCSSTVVWLQNNLEGVPTTDGDVDVEAFASALDAIQLGLTQAGNGTGDDLRNRGLLKGIQRLSKLAK